MKVVYTVMRHAVHTLLRLVFDDSNGLRNREGVHDIEVIAGEQLILSPVRHQPVVPRNVGRPIHPSQKYNAFAFELASLKQLGNPCCIALASDFREPLYFPDSWNF